MKIEFCYRIEDDKSSKKIQEYLLGLGYKWKNGSRKFRCSRYGYPRSLKVKSDGNIYYDDVNCTKCVNKKHCSLWMMPYRSNGINEL